jgi:RNA polymerase sigma-70 factor (ECF subfamily)
MAWVHGIAGYKLIDYLRRTKHAAINIEDIDTAADGTSPQDDISNRIDSQNLIARLPARTQNLLSKVKLQGMSVREAASQEGISENAAKVAIHRGIKALAAHVQEKQA